MYMLQLRSLLLLFALANVLQATVLPKNIHNTVYIGSEEVFDQPPVLLSRGRSRGSKPSRPKPSRPKPKPKSTPKPKPTTLRNSRPTRTKGKSSKKPTVAPSVRPKPPPKFPFPTTAFDTCDVYVDCSKDDEVSQLELSARSASQDPALVLVKRDVRIFPVQVGTSSIKVRALDYPSSSNLYTTGVGKKLPVHTLGFKDQRIGTITVTDTHKLPAQYPLFYTEHIIELQSVESFFINKWNKELPQMAVNNRKPKPNIMFGKGRRSMNALVFEALGSNLNRKGFVLCDRQINAYKEKLWSQENPMEAGTATSKFEKLVHLAYLGELPSNEYLSAIRTTIAVFHYMNDATVEANLREAMENVKIELQHVRSLTGEKADVASLWEAFLRQQITKMEAYGKKWLNARIRHATAELVKATKKYQKMNADRKKQEKKAEWNKKQNAERLKLDTVLKKANADLATAKQKVTALEMRRDNLVKQIQKAKGPVKKTLEDEKEDVKKKTKAAKNEVEAKRRTVGKTQRKILELTAAGVQQILHNLQMDKQTLAKFRSSVAMLRMPTL